MEKPGNSFDLIRHLAALLVLFSHQYALLLKPEPLFLSWDTYGSLAVLIFFTISGYFMPNSFTNAGGFWPYILRRCLRIFPGLIFCAFFMCYFLGPIFTSEDILTYLSDASTLRTCLSYCLFFRHPLPGVFDDFLYKSALNGSLWTLPIEFAFYIGLGLILTFKAKKPMLLASFILAWISLSYFKIFGIPFELLARFHPYYLALYATAFTLGSLAFMYKAYWFKYRLKLIFISLMTLPLCPAWLIVINLSILTLATGSYFQEKLINRKFDLSYGLYIYAFPIQQIVINTITKDFWPGLALAIFGTMLIAYFSYRFIEKPFLSWKIKQIPLPWQTLMYNRK